MRIGYKKFKEIKKWYGSSDFEIGYDTNGLTIRFGYWRSVDLDGLKKTFTRLFKSYRKSCR